MTVCNLYQNMKSCNLDGNGAESNKNTRNVEHLVSVQKVINFHCIKNSRI